MSRVVTGVTDIQAVATTEQSTAPGGLASGTTKPTVNNSNHRIAHSSDARVLLCAPSATVTSYMAWFISGGVANRKYFPRVYFRINQLPTNTVSLMNVVSAGGGALASIRLTSGGKLQLIDDRNSVQIGSDSTDTLVANTWYMIEIGISVASPVTASSFLEGYYQLLDSGTPVLLGTSANRNFVSSSPPGTVSVGITTSTGLAGTQVKLCDFAINDDQGSAPHNTYPGPGHVHFHFTNSDNAAGNWTDGAGGGTGLADALNGGGAAARGAPAGVAPGSATAASQAKDLGAGVSDPLDLNLDTYTAQGIDGTLQIVLVQPIVCFGNDGATDVTAGVQLVSNPAVGEATQASGTGAAVGTHATNWRWLKGLLGLAPTPTLGTAPVLRIRKASAAGIHADYAGLIVETKPAGVTAIGASLAQPYTVSAPVGSSCAQPYTVRMFLAKSVVLPYSVRAFFAKSLVLLYSVAGAVGRSLALPYTVIHVPTNISPPHISGVAQVGQVLTVTPGVWQP